MVRLDEEAAAVKVQVQVQMGQGGAALLSYEQYGLLFDATFVLTAVLATAALLWRRRQSSRLVETLRGHYSSSPSSSSSLFSLSGQKNAVETAMKDHRDHKER